MKNIKINLSKTSWIILSIGIFIVVLAGLGVTYSQQMKTSNELQQDLDVSEIRLAKYDNAGLEQQESELVAQLETIFFPLEAGDVQLSTTDVFDIHNVVVNLPNAFEALDNFVGRRRSERVQ